METTANQIRELFHLLFLHALSQRWARTSRPWAVKGGCAMRFFFGSNRYSVDLDIDAPGFSESALKSAIDPTVESVERGLRQRQLGSIESHTLVKEGENVFRIKLALKTSTGEAIPTKIEFSRRRLLLASYIVAKPPAPNVREPVGFPAYFLPTYSREAMVALKVGAIAGRTVIRDIFDLALFLPTDCPTNLLKALKLDSDGILNANRWVLGSDADYDAYLREIAPYMGGETNLSKQSWDDLRSNVSRTLILWSELRCGS